MTYAAQMLDAYPAEMNVDTKQLARAIEALTTCSQTCTACADACLSEDPGMLPHLTRCIRDNLDCADICDTTARVLSRHTGYDATLTRPLVEAARQAVKTCGDSCAEHRDAHDHCRVCEQSCRDSERALDGLLPALEPSGVAPSAPSQAAPQT